MMNTQNMKTSKSNKMKSTTSNRRKVYPFNRSITLVDTITGKKIKRFITSRQYNY